MSGVAYKNSAAIFPLLLSHRFLGDAEGDPDLAWPCTQRCAVANVRAVVARNLRRLARNCPLPVVGLEVAGSRQRESDELEHKVETVEAWVAQPLRMRSSV